MMNRLALGILHRSLLPLTSRGITTRPTAATASTALRHQQRYASASAAQQEIDLSVRHYEGSAIRHYEGRSTTGSRDNMPVLRPVEKLDVTPKQTLVKPQSSSTQTPTFRPSQEQSQIFNAIQRGDFDSLIVDAKAGSGKTTTIIESLQFLPQNSHVILLAYNKNISQVLKLKSTAAKKTHNLPLRISTRTFHGLGYELWRKHLGLDTHSFLISQRKSSSILEKLATKEEFELYHLNAIKLVSFAKLHGLTPSSLKLSGLVQDSDEQWYRLMELYGMHISADKDVKTLLRLSRTVLTESIKQSGGGRGKKSLKFAKSDRADGRFVLDFDDMIYLPVVHRVDSKLKFDYIYVDEAQDMSDIRVGLLNKLRASTNTTTNTNINAKKSDKHRRRTRLIAFGDRFQAIYGFAGCTSSFFNDLHSRGTTSLRVPLLTDNSDKEDPVSSDNAQPTVPVPEKVQVLNLSTCYRCPTAVISHAGALVSGIHAKEEAPSGKVENLKSDWSPSTLFTGNPTLVLSRDMRTLVNFGFYLLSNNITFGFLGRQVGPLAIVKLLNEVLAHVGPAPENNYTVVKGAERMDIHELVRMVDKWREAYLGGALDPIDEIDQAALEDQYDSFMILLTQNHHLFNNAGDFIQFLETRFLQPLKEGTEKDGFAGVLLSTMHQSRGLERHNVVLLNEGDWQERVYGKMRNTPRPWHFWRWKKDGILPQPWEIEQEKNLLYIAWTRAKDTLYFIDWKERRKVSLPTSHLPAGAPDYLVPARKISDDYLYLLARLKDKKTGMNIEKRLRPWKRKWDAIVKKTLVECIDVDPTSQSVGYDEPDNLRVEEDEKEREVVGGFTK